MNNQDASSSPAVGEFEPILFRPTRHNIHWRELRKLLEKMGDVVQERNGCIKVTRNGHTVSLVPSRGDVGVDTIEDIRRFLEKSAAAENTEAEVNAPWLALIDHDEIRIFHTDSPGATFLRVARNPRNGHLSHGHGGREFANDPGETNRFFETAAIALAAAPEVVCSGSGKGSASERDAFIKWLGVHHKGLTSHVIAGERSDRKHLSDDQQLAAIRAHCSDILRVPAKCC